ncbi:hypothetical protein JCM8208_005813 [Rhodotorula glutinis]
MSSQDHLSSHLARLTLSPSRPEQNLSPILKLPNELLEVILELAYSPKRHEWYMGPHPLKQSHKPVCRRLWPLQQRLRYRNVEIDSKLRLGLFARTIVEGPRRFGPLVQHLSVSLSPFGRRDLSYSPGMFGDESQPDAIIVYLSRFFSTLGRLESLKLSLMCPEPFDGSLERALLRTVVHNPVGTVELDALRYLEVRARGFTADGDRPSDVSPWMRHVTRFSGLETLHLYVEGEFPTSFIQVDPQEDPSASMVLENLSVLRLFGNFERWDLSLNLIAPSLDILFVETRNQALSPILRHVPLSVHDLGVMTHHHAGWPEHVDHLLSSLRNLSKLYVSLSCCNAVRLSRSLHGLDHLAHLAIEYGDLADMSDGLVDSLVEGSERLDHLRTLTIHELTLECEYGPTLKSKRCVLPEDDERDGSGLWPGWVAPRWPDGLSEAGLSRAFAVARSRGIDVTLDLESALDWRKAFERERDLVAVCRGLSMDDWTDARRFLGDERIDAFLSRRRREGRRRSLGRELSLL